MSEEVLDSNGSSSVGVRPTVVTVTAIIYWVFAGIALIVLILGTIAMGAIEGVANAAADAGGDVSGVQTGSVWGLLIVAIIVTIAGIIGTIKMWKMEKIGFYIFVGAYVVSILNTVIFVGFSVGSLIFPIIFIALFGSQLKNMR